MAKEILVTGGAGYIGSHTVLALLDAGYTPVVIDNLSTGVRSLLPSDICFFEVDIRDECRLDEILGAFDFLAVLHFAGSTSVPESIEDPLSYYCNNTAASRILLSACVRAGIPHFVFSSTAAVYGNPQVLPVIEASPLLPLSPYGRSKRMTEIMLNDVGVSTGLTWAALRYFNVAGADPAGRIGQMSTNTNHLIKVACEVICGIRDSMTVFGGDYDTPDGTCIRDYIHVSDLADAHIKVLDYLLKGGDSLVANCGYGHGFSVRQILDTLEKVAGQPIHYEVVQRREGDIVEMVADSQLLRRLTEWKPQCDSIETILESALRFERYRCGISTR